MFEPLKRPANPLSTERPVIQVPAEAEHKRSFSNALSLLMLVALIAMATQFWAESETRTMREHELVSRVESLDKKHTLLLDLIQKSDKYLDTRMQLDVLELRSDFRALRNKVDTLNPSAVEALRHENTALNDYVKSEIYFMNKRLHNNEREHSQFYNKLDALSQAVATVPATATEPAAS